MSYSDTGCSHKWILWNHARRNVSMGDIAKDSPPRAFLDARRRPHRLCALLCQVKRPVVEDWSGELEAVPARRVPGGYRGV